ncbi:hypothetical protein PF005_g7807 [Phytophthora fragariae]|uniref:DUF7869 domain-containing protein n=1 Tax=Phytophthora fragariae TaxID=53985 RepID=A0A6A3YIX1_9STRA|nr:hypothetical protein PF005_g7807 [Phytophthora fragariae]
MSPNEKKQSVLTALALLMKTDTAVRRRGTGVRQTFTFYLPLVGRVCRDVWCSVYGVSTATITRYRRQIQAGAFSVQAHRGKMNLNASKIDIRWVAQWFQGFAATLGDVVPVRVRSQETIDGVVRKRYSAEDYTLLPAFFTWDQLYTEMQNYVAENEMDSGVTADLTEELGVHTAAAKTMRKEYQNDLEAASDERAVIVMDFSQNLTLPSVSATPSQWYFLSLVDVYLFGIYYANKNIQYNYVYEESVAGKGTDEVNSMLFHFIQKIVVANGHQKLTIYADNCGGQNKNNFVVKMLLGLAQMGELETIDLKFFIKGHTKNAVDRGFGHIRKKFAREDVWTMDQLLEVVNAASSSALVHVPKENAVMKVFRTAVQEAYKDMKSVQSYQIFGMATDNPGVVSCRAGPNSEVVTQDLRRSFDSIPTSDEKVRDLFESHLDPLQPPLPNFEKKQQMFNKVRMYVPDEFRSDPIYDAPNDEEEQKANVRRRAVRLQQQRRR